MILPVNPKTCGHAKHVGSCGCCQRAAATRHAAQLASAVAIERARAWRARAAYFR